MFGSQTLEVVIGLIFIFLLLSLLATAINELIMSFLSYRGKDLEKAIKIMLEDTSGKNAVVSGEKFYQLPLISKLAERGKNKRPSYLSKTSFSRALLILLSDSNQDYISLDNIRKTIDAMPDGDTKKILSAYLKDAGASLVRFRAYLETWYEEMMDRASGWYKRRVQYWLIGIGFMLALLFNADTFFIARKLSIDPEARKSLMTMAQQYHTKLTSEYDQSGLAANGELRMLLTSENKLKLEALLGKYAKSSSDSILITSLYTNQKQIERLLHDDLAKASTVLGMGWNEDNQLPPDISTAQVASWLLTKFVGLLITALAISLGAPFWFDMLNKVMNIRGTGIKPEEKRVQLAEPPLASQPEARKQISLYNPQPESEESPAYG